MTTGSAHKTSFRRLIELVSRIDPALYPAGMPPRQAFVEQLRALLQEPGAAIDRFELWSAVFDRFLSLEAFSALDLHEDPAEQLATWLADRQFRLSLPSRLRALADFRIDYYLHIPKTGGQSFVNNLLHTYRFAVWNTEPSGPTDYVYYDLPQLLSKAASNGWMLVHSHLFLPHVCDHLRLDAADRVIVTLREPWRIHISNASYIHDHIVAARQAAGPEGEIAIDPSWREYAELVSAAPDRRSAVRAILKSASYRAQYAEIYCKYIFGEASPDAALMDFGVDLVSRRFAFLQIDRIDETLQRHYGIGKPVIHNRAGVRAEVSRYLLAEADWAPLIGRDQGIHERFLAAAQASDTWPGSPG